MNEKHETIEVPENWDAKQDFDDFEDRFGKSDDYFLEVKSRVETSHVELEMTLDEALSYFNLRTYNFKEAAEIVAKIVVLTQYFEAHSPSAHYRKRFLEHLDYCRFAEAEYIRLRPLYRAKNDDGWLFPLAELADHIASAAWEFNEGMECEHDDYTGTDPTP